MKQFGWEECLIDKIRKMQCRYNMSWWRVVADCVLVTGPGQQLLRGFAAAWLRASLRMGLV